MSIRSPRWQRSTAGLAAAAAFALALTACNSSGAQTSLGGGDDAGSGQSGDLTELNISMVPVIDALPVMYAQDNGYYEDAGLDVNFSDTDSGPAVVTAVVNGTYDAAYTAWFPAMIAMSKGAKIKFISAVSVSDPKGGTSGVVVKPDSPIDSYSDLEGKTVATNALTSLTTLSTKIQMKEHGADPESINFTALPFKASVQAVAQGQADAAVVVSPFQTEAKMNGMRIVADPITESMPGGAPGLVLFTSTESAGEKADALKAFNEATVRAAEELQGKEDLRRQMAREVLGLPEDVAEQVPMPGIATEPIDLQKLQQQADLAYEYGYLKNPLMAEDLVADF